MRIACTGTDIRCTRRDTLTTGMVGLTAEFHFNSEWDGIIGKTAVFRSGDVAKEVLILSSGVVTVPWEVFHTAGEKLLVGVYGTDGEGNTWPAPTPYCDAGEIRKGTESAEAGEDPTPSVVDQILTAAEHAETVAQSVRDDADSGVFDGADGRDGVDGKSAYQYAVEGGYTGTETQFYRDISRQPVIHDQSTASDTWTINHNMGKYPSVSVVDSAGTVCEGTVTYIDSNTVVCHFNGAFSGTAYLN